MPIPEITPINPEDLSLKTGHAQSANQKSSLPKEFPVCEIVDELIVPAGYGNSGCLPDLDSTTDAHRMSAVQQGRQSQSVEAAPTSILHVSLFTTVAAIAFLIVAFQKFFEYTLYTLPQSSDLCWIIRTGDWISSHQQLPQHDLFCWWNHTHALVCYQWTYMLFASVIDKVAGLWTIGLISTIVGGIILFWYLPKQWLLMGIRPCFVYGAVCLIFSRYWNLPRPQLFACLLLILLLEIIARVRTHSESKAVFLLPILFVFWVNFHLSWSFGLLILTAFQLQSLRCPMSKQNRFKLWTVFALCIGAVFCNPYGTTLVQYGLTFTNSDQFLKVYETVPAFQAPDLQPFVCYCVIAAGTIIRCFRRFEADRTIIALSAIVLGLSINRFEPITVILSWQLAGEALLKLSSYSDAKTMPPGTSAVQRTSSIENLIAQFAPKMIGLAAILLVCVSMWQLRCSVSGDAYHQLICGSPEILALPQKRHKHRLYNDPVLGSWMIYANTGRPLIDNHFDLYDKGLCEEVYACKFSRPDCMQLLKKSNFDCLLIPKRCPLSDVLKSAPSDWKKLADDDVITYWEKVSN